MAKNRTTRRRNDTSAKAKAKVKPRRSKKKDTQGSYKGVPYDSLEELAFLQWASELQKAGYIKSIQRSPSFLLSDSVSNDYVIQKITTSKPAIQTLLQGHSYTPEFIIIWTKKSRDKIIWTLEEPTKFDKVFVGTKEENGEYKTFIEIKPMWDQNNMERLFKVNQKWMWQKHQIFVNLIKCQELFTETFTPNEYLTTKTGRSRTIRWKVKTVYEFLNSK
jgi:hypothetical protein